MHMSICVYICVIINPAYIASYKHAYFKHLTSRTNNATIIYMVCNIPFYEEFTKASTSLGAPYVLDPVLEGCNVHEDPPPHTPK